MKKLKKIFIAALAITFITLCLVDVARYPEAYITTWKYQLENDIKAGDSEAIEYYQTNYIANGRILFD